MVTMTMKVNIYLAFSVVLACLRILFKCVCVCVFITHKVIRYQLTKLESDGLALESGLLGITPMRARYSNEEQGQKFINRSEIKVSG